MGRSTSFNRLSDVLTDLLKDYSLEKISYQARIFRLWSQVVGPTVAANATPEDLRNRRLYLLVGSSAWIQELTLLKPSLIKDLNAALGEDLVDDLVLKLGSRPPRNGPQGS